MFHPGPPTIEPRSKPGGVVVHVYGYPSGTFLVESAAATGAQATFNAGLDHDRAAELLPAGDRGFCLVAYDGDSGDRYAAEDWLR